MDWVNEMSTGEPRASLLSENLLCDFLKMGPVRSKHARDLIESRWLGVDKFQERGERNQSAKN